MPQINPPKDWTLNAYVDYLIEKGRLSHDEGLELKIRSKSDKENTMKIIAEALVEVMFKFGIKI